MPHDGGIDRLTDHGVRRGTRLRMRDWDGRTVMKGTIEAVRNDRDPSNGFSESGEVTRSWRPGPRASLEEPAKPRGPPSSTGGPRLTTQATRR